MMPNWKLSAALVLSGVLLLALGQWLQPNVPPLVKVMEARDFSKAQAIVKKLPGQVNQEYQGRRPLHLAAIYNAREMVQTLLQHGALPNVGDSYGNTPLHVAVFCRRSQVVPLLLAAGAKPNGSNYFGDTPMHYAAWVGASPSTVSALLLAGADLQIRNRAGDLPLDIARRRHRRIYQQLAKYLEKRRSFSHPPAGQQAPP